jgi:hypothetical protein
MMGSEKGLSLAILSMAGFTKAELFEEVIE